MSLAAQEAERYMSVSISRSVSDFLRFFIRKRFRSKMHFQLLEVPKFGNGNIEITATTNLLSSHPAFAKKVSL